MESIKSFLATVPGFDSLGDLALGEVAQQVEARSYDAGQYLMRRGEEGECMHVLVEGQVHIPIVGDDGKSKLTINLGPRELIGEMALLTGGPRTADVIAETPVRTLLLRRAVVSGLLAEHPDLARFLAAILGQRLGEQGGISTVGKYRIVGAIGSGNNGKVFRALHPTLHRVVAVKMLAHDLLHQPGFRDRFLGEARTLAGLSHENIVEIFDTEEAYGTLFIVMEAVEGSDLERLLRQRGRLGPDEVSRILLGVASALSYAHERGVAHRDIKPANVAIEPSGRVKLMDFGLARAIRDDPQARTKTIDGTPQYLAPEIALGLEGDGRVDVYALGVMGFQMATGRPPFESDTVPGMLKAHVKDPPPDVRRLNPDLPAGLVTFIEGALEKDPARRLADWDHIKKLLAPPAAGPRLREPMEERIVRIRCLPSVAGEVDEAIARMRTGLSRESVSIAIARIREDEAQ